MKVICLQLHWTMVTSSLDFNSWPWHLSSFSFAIPEILYGVSVRQVYWPVTHNDTMVIMEGIGTFDRVDQVLLEN